MVIAKKINMVKIAETMVILLVGMVALDHPPITINATSPFADDRECPRIGIRS